MSRNQRSPTPENHPSGGSNIAHSHTSGNLFPSQKLKGSHTFTARSVMVESNRVPEDSGTIEEVESFDREDPKTSGGVKGADQSLGYIVHLVSTVELYQKKNQNCFRCGSPDHLVNDCPKDLIKTT